MVFQGGVLSYENSRKPAEHRVVDVLDVVVDVALDAVEEIVLRAAVAAASDLADPDVAPMVALVLRRGCNAWREVAPGLI